MECSDFKAHVTGCGECSVYLQEIEQVSGLLGGLAPVELPRELHSYVMTSIRRQAAGHLTLAQRSIDFSAMIWFMLRAGSAQPASPTMRAGTPATVLLLGTGDRTTEPAATREQ